MTRILLSATLAATLAAAVAAAAVPTVCAATSTHHDRVLMKRKTAHHAARSSGTGTGIVTGGKSTATGGTPGGMPDRQ